MSSVKKQILCVDDDSFTLTGLKEALGESYDVLLAMEADTGIKLARKYRPDLIVLDVNMPGMDGIEAAEILRKLPETQSIPLIFLSAYDTELEIRRAEALQAAAFIGKPCSSREVCNTVRNVVGE